jgi:gliding motility-associated lipoprotein GldD
MRKLFIFSTILLILGIVVYALLLRTPETTFPKPIGYFRIDLPQPQYRTYEAPCAFSIPVSQFATIEQLDQSQSDSCRFNIFYPKLKARIHCTYLPVSNNIHDLVVDAYTFAAKHEMKASAIEKSLIEEEERKVFGIRYRIEGEAASPLQFFVTDSTTHYLRCALYFESAPNPDSIAPVYQYIERDMDELIKKVLWR